MWPDDISSMSPDEFDQWLASLDPQAQQDVINQLQLGSANTLPSSFAIGGGFLPELSGNQYSTASFGAIPPEISSKGAVQPFDLTDASKAGNVQQDRFQMLTDPEASLFAGPGGFAPGTFDPTGYEYSGSPISTPGITYLQNMGSGGTSANQLLAQLVSGGMDPTAAFNEVVFTAAHADDKGLDPDKRALAIAVRDTLPMITNGTTQANPDNPSYRGPVNKEAQWALDKGYDLGAFQAQANDLSSALMSDPYFNRYNADTGEIAGLFQDPETGLYYTQAPEEKYNKTAQAYRDAGYAFPTDQYTDDKYIDAVSPFDWGAKQAETMTAKSAKDTADQRSLKQGGQLDQIEGLYNQYAQEAQGQSQSLLQQNPALAARLGQPARPGPAPSGASPGLAFGASAPGLVAGKTIGGGAAPPAGNAGSNVTLTDVAAAAQPKPMYMRETPGGDLRASSGWLGQLLAGMSQNAQGAGPMSLLHPQDAVVSRDSLAKKRGGLRDQQSTTTQAYAKTLALTPEMKNNIAARTQAAWLATQGRTPLMDQQMQRQLALRATGVYG